MYTLHWRKPYDWAWMFDFLRARAVAGVEEFSATRYVRTFHYHGHRG